MGILLYHFSGEHKLLMKHKVLLDGKYTAIDPVGTMKHIGPISKHEYIYRTYTLVVGAEFKVTCQYNVHTLPIGNQRASVS